MSILQRLNWWMNASNSYRWLGLVFQNSITDWKKKKTTKKTTKKKQIKTKRRKGKKENKPNGKTNVAINCKETTILRLIAVNSRQPTAESREPAAGTGEKPISDVVKTASCAAVKQMAMQTFNLGFIELCLLLFCFWFYWFFHGLIALQR